MLQLRPEAEQEIVAAAEWYESRRSGLAAEFLRSLDAALAGVERNPLQYPQVRLDLRRAVLRRFPYSLIFCVADNEIVVLACVHWRQSPRRWQGRR